MKKNILAMCAAAVLLATIYGCGYRVSSGAEAKMPGGVKSIAIIPFENRTLEPEAGTIMAEAMQREVYRRGMAKVLPKGEAEAVLEGRVLEISLDPQAYDDDNFTTAYRVKMVVSAKLVRGNETLWKTNRLAREEDIEVGSNNSNTIARRHMAIARMAEDIAEQIHIGMVEGW